MHAEDFEEYEVRVIRPRYFAKRKRFELGGQVFTVMNQSFIYTYLATGILNYHFTETFGFELLGGYGFSIDKNDKTILKQKFDIRTAILRTQYLFDAGVNWTPVYGKFQLSSGRMVYFDTFLSAGGGLTGIHYQYEHCDSNRVGSTKPADQTVAYPGVFLGLGQRIFLSKNASLRWDVRNYMFTYNTADGSCTPEDKASGKSDFNYNIILQLGASRFF